MIIAAALAALPAAASARPAAFHGRVSTLSTAQRARMTGISWRAGCPLPLSSLRLLTVWHWGFDGRVHTGRLVVDGGEAGALLTVFARLYAAHFRIRQMRPVDDYGGSDFRSIEADNTSAFNCRAATGSTRWSEHAYGRAIDINPIENPYVSSGQTAHRASVTFLDRSNHRRGMAYEGGVLVEAFRAIGWGWGGSWTGTKDYQHFSASGR